MEVIRKTGKIRKSVVLSMHTRKLFLPCGCSSSVERQLPKLDRRVRLPSSAPKKESSTRLFFFIAQFQEISFYVKNSPTKCFTGEFFLALWVLRFKCRILNHKPVQERNFNQNKIGLVIVDGCQLFVVGTKQPTINNQQQ